MDKFLFIFGTRPEAIKMAPVVNKFNSSDLDIRICVTAQHREMLDQVLAFFEITPDYDLNLMTSNQTLNLLSGKLFFKLDEVFDDYSPDIVFVHGDTTTSTIAAQAAFHRKINVAHVEAGLRTYNKYSPFPEELNRQITSRIADWHFAPTQRAKSNLLKEGVPEDRIIVTGNTVVDAINLGLSKLDNGYTDEEIESLAKIIQPDKKLILVTGHRRENFGSGFKSICQAILDISQRTDVQIIYPVHLNPNVQNPVQTVLADKPNITLLPPLGYPAFLYLMRKSYFIITDSGGIQEEAPTLKKPVLVMRDVTERPEALETGSIKLVGTNRNNIVTEAIQLLNDDSYYKSMASGYNPFGDGNSCQRILDVFHNE